MPIVNYVREHIRFMEYAADENLTASERLLWFALMHIHNQRAQDKYWPDDFIRISNDRLLTYCPMKFDTMAKARNALKQRGLIEFEKGDKNKKHPAYRMIYFFPQQGIPDNCPDGNSNPNNSDNTGDNMGYNAGYNTGDNMGYNAGYNTGDIYINYTDKPIPETIHNPTVTPSTLVTPVVQEEDDENNINDPVLMRAREEVKTSWKQCFGSFPNPSIVDNISFFAAKRFKFGEGIINEAICLAATKMVTSPVDYILTLFRDWGIHQKVKTLDDLEYYLDERAN